ncbi:hypothetical protein F2Q69_00049003 [Brassica cretica]|uniref:Uncharacterized protein n=1 Tax=Brassica cretica TaxID=69181 RepID=A0A8S9Q0J0_BRACR|nr:hypothetical protein F2Q69_00049003 [Brassica cretica]
MRAGWSRVTSLSNLLLIPPFPSPCAQDFQLRNWAKLVAVLSLQSDPCNPSQTSDRSSVVACSPLPTVAVPVPNVKLFASSSGFLTP